MKTGVIIRKDFLAGRNIFPRSGRASHNLKAEWVPGDGIKVTTPDGEEIEVSYGATEDMRSCYAYVKGLGFIGGWQYPHRKQAFASLVNSINEGILYHSTSDLPSDRGKK